jgi:hypothetical protein
MSEYKRPPEGTDVNERRVIELLPVPPSPCVALYQGTGKVLLSKDELETLAVAADSISKVWKEDSWRVSEEERLRMIAGKRARDLLQAISRAVDGLEYLVDESKLSNSDYLYVVTDMLEEGTAAVISLKTGNLIPSICVHYDGFRAGPLFGRGLITFSFDDNGDKGFLFSIEWWVS